MGHFCVEINTQFNRCRRFLLSGVYGAAESQVDRSGPSRRGSRGRSEIAVLNDGSRIPAKAVDPPRPGALNGPDGAARATDAESGFAAELTQDVILVSTDGVGGFYFFSTGTNVFH